MGEDTASRPIYVELSTGSHLAILTYPSDTVADLKKKLSAEHATCFSNVGSIKITAVKVKRRGAFYHLSDSIVVNDAFHGVKGHWFLQVDAIVVEDDDINICDGFVSVLISENDRIPNGNTCVDVNGTGLVSEGREESKVGLDQNSGKEMEEVKEDEMNNIEEGNKGFQMNCGKVSHVNSTVSGNWLDKVVTRALSSVEKSNVKAVPDEQVALAGREESELFSVFEKVSYELMAKKDESGEAFYSLEDDPGLDAFVVEPRSKIKRKKTNESALAGVDEYVTEPKSCGMEFKRDDQTKHKAKKKRKRTSDEDEMQELTKRFEVNDSGLITNVEAKNNRPTVLEEGKHDGDEIRKLVVSESNAQTMDCMIETEDNYKFRPRKKSTRVTPNGTIDEVAKKSTRDKKVKQNKELESHEREKANGIDDELNTQSSFGAVVDVMINELSDYPTDTRNLQVDQELKKKRKSTRKNKNLSGFIASASLQTPTKGTKKQMEKMTTEKELSSNRSSSGDGDNIGALKIRGNQSK